MADYTELKAAIRAAIFDNTEQAITGESLQEILVQMVDELGESYVLPEGGIPASDLEQAVRDALAEAVSAYQLPVGGIPEADLAQAVRNALAAGISAYQKPQSGIPETDLAQAVRNALAAALSAYQKPSGGIPKTDLSQSVQTVLDNAEGALTQNDIADNLTTDDATKVLSAKQGKVLDGKVSQLGQEVDDLDEQINGVDAYVPVELNLQQGYFNTQVGSAPYKIQATRTPLEGYMCSELQVAPGDHFKISGDNYGVYIQRLWAFADADNNRLTYADNAWHQSTMLVDEEIIAPENAVRLVVNFRNYDASTCGLKKLSQLEGLEERVIACEEAISKPYDGKTIVCLGDSITEGVARIAQPYPFYLAEILGATVINGGIGGTRMTARAAITPTTAPGAYAAFDFVNLSEAIASGNWSDQLACGEYLRDEAGTSIPLNVANQLAVLDWSKVDYIIVCFGLNDWMNGVQLGQLTDGNAGALVPKYSTSEFLGAYNKAIHNLMSVYKKVKVCLLTSPVGYRTNEPYSASFEASRWGSNYKLNNGETLEGYAEATIEVAKYNTIPVFDFYHECGWNRDNFAQYHLQSDGETVNTIHPASGYDYIAHKLAGWLVSQWK